jgi:tetratricopeptide (TPR) repeat protein
MSHPTSWHKVVPISASAKAEAYSISANLALDIGALPQPALPRVDWNRPGLNASIAYQMGEVRTAEIIVKNALSEIDCWLPSTLKLFAVLLYTARLAFYRGELEIAANCYKRAYELMIERQIDIDFGSAAADLYDEWGDCHLLLGLTDEAMDLYRMAVNTDLACYDTNPDQMSTLRLAKLADFMSLKGAQTNSDLCLQLAMDMAVSPVEKLYVRMFCGARSGSGQ